MKRGRNRTQTSLRRDLSSLVILSGLMLLMPWALSRVETELVRADARNTLRGSTQAVTDQLAAAPAHPQHDGPTHTDTNRRHPGAIKPGSIVGLLEIPRLDLEVAVLEGADPTILRHAAGHLPETAMPEEPGNVAIAAHRDSHFRRLENIRQGDRIQLRRPRGVFVYEVERTLVTEPTNVSVLDTGDGPELTLITCYPFRYVGSAPQRFIVRARLLAESRLLSQS